MNNILILTGHFGMGHNSAALAIKEDIEASSDSVNVKIVDIVEYLMPKISKGIYRGFNKLVTRKCNLYNLICKIAARYTAAPFKYVFIKNIERMIIEFKPDVVVSTLPMSSQYIAAYKKKKKSLLPLITCITDISAHDEWIAEYTDLYFVATLDVKQELICRGIKASKVKVVGIPVKQAFKKTEKQCHKDDKKHVLIMGGGLGLIPNSDNIFEELNNAKQISTTVITGSNYELYNLVKEKYPNLNAITYTNDVYKYMDQADLLISKAGGITMFEAIYSMTPICVINPFLEQEIRNAKFIEENKLGKVLLEKGNKLVSDIMILLSSEVELTKIKNNMENIKKQIASVSLAGEMKCIRETI